MEEKALRSRWGARRVKCEVRAHWCEGEGVKGALGCAQGTRGGGRKGSALEWQGGGRLSAAKTRVGWPEEPHLRGVLMVGCRRSENSGASQCVGCGVILRRRAREKDAAVRRGVISRRKRVVRKVTRMRKRVTRGCGVRCMEITTRRFFAQGLKRRGVRRDRLCARSQASRPSSSSSSRAPVRS